MKWSEVLGTLDKARDALLSGEKKACEANTLSQLVEYRTLLRARWGKMLESEVPDDDQLAQDILSLALPYAPSQIAVHAQIDDLLACAPSEEARQPDKPGAIRVAASSHDGATMVIQPREQPFVPQAPDLEEVTEDEVAK